MTIGRQARRALVCGAGGFIGCHLVRRLKREGFWVRGVDLKFPDFSDTAADEFVVGDLRDQGVLPGGRRSPLRRGLPARGGHGRRRLHLHRRARRRRHAQLGDDQPQHGRCLPAAQHPRRVLLVVGLHVPGLQPARPREPGLREDSAYPAEPDSEYGWEKLFTERLYLAYNRNHGMADSVARYHNIFGPEGTWTGGKEKAPAAICRKVAEAADGGEIEIWGDGSQTRSFLYIDECVEGSLRLARRTSPGRSTSARRRWSRSTSSSISSAISPARGLHKRHIPGPQGVRGRNSDNRLIGERLGWKPSLTLRSGLEETYRWIEEQVGRRRMAA